MTSAKGKNKHKKEQKNPVGYSIKKINQFIAFDPECYQFIFTGSLLVFDFYIHTHNIGPCKKSATFNGELCLVITMAQIQSPLK